MNYVLPPFRIKTKTAPRAAPRGLRLWKMGTEVVAALPKYQKYQSNSRPQQWAPPYTSWRAEIALGVSVRSGCKYRQIVQSPGGSCFFGGSNSKPALSGDRCIFWGGNTIIEYNLKNTAEKSYSLDCFVTDLPMKFERLGKTFLGEPIGNPQLVNDI